MDIDRDRYQRSYLYRFRVSLHYLGKQSESLKQRAMRAVRRALVRTGVFVFVVIVILYMMQAQTATYGIALVGLGATILAWTAFRVHEKSFREAALVPEDVTKDDTSYQERVSMTSLNYAYALVGVSLVIFGFTIRIYSRIF
jgi:hypothetical protein